MVENTVRPQRAREKAQAENPVPARPRGRGRPVGDRDARRAELLNAAIAVIEEEGFAGASLRKVAQRAGCTTGAVTYYFANKEAMMTAVIESRFDVFDTLLGKGDAQIDLRAGFERWLELTRSDMGGGWVAGLQLLAHAQHDPALAAVYQRRYGRYRRRFATMLEEGQQRGVIRNDIPAELLADHLSAMGDGWMMLLPIEADRFEPARITALLDSMIAMVSPPGAGPASKPAG